MKRVEERYKQGIEKRHQRSKQSDPIMETSYSMQGVTQ